MRAPAMRACALLAAVALLPALGCGPNDPGPNAELRAMLDFAAYPGGVLVNQWSTTSGGPIPMPGNYGGREYRTDDTPPKIRAHYEQLARANGWTINPPSAPPELGLPGQEFVGELALKQRSLRITVSTSIVGQNYGNRPYPYPVPAEKMPSTPPPSPGASPTPTPTLPPGPWYVRIEGNAPSH